jgi:hypothetical protein
MGFGITPPSTKKISRSCRAAWKTFTTLSFRKRS